ncbi:acetylglutamate kinase [Flagellimonas allohymeniacidonis]|uniref:Acetylglutamate kinase n=1 Tax=Flagellimonas allohymeniacidonis TaxID=2517819 RepID=A0A4Q8QC75_9FLAO|nr:acetylglutamate kinase [Allomuricauda hymeniacidonis]TAI48002.1 acetylglutamate kinase [Allomuricauda hymeniacidonis]
MKETLSIVKIGGNIIEDNDGLFQLLQSFSHMKGAKILVHGGGKKATEMGNKLGIEAKMTNGRRITDAQSLDVAVMVYGGLVNKNIVAKLQGLGTNSIGMSGADGGSIRAHKRAVQEVDFGFVGDIEAVNAQGVFSLLQTGFTPVFCALTHDGKGQLLNTNADTIASELAVGLTSHFETTLYYCFEKKGVLRNVSDENSVITHIDSHSYKTLLEEGIISDGMLPKLHNCFYALQNKVKKVCIGDSSMIRNESTTFTTLTL